MREHFDEPQSKHHTREERKREEETCAGAVTAGTGEVVLRTGDRTEVTDQRREVKGTEPFFAGRHLVENAREEDHGQRQRNVRTDADLFLLRFRLGSGCLRFSHE